MKRTKPDNIDDYLSRVPEDARATLEKLRRAIRAAVPKATETISYQIPTFKYHGSGSQLCRLQEALQFFPRLHRNRGPQKGLETILVVEGNNPFSD